MMPEVPLTRTEEAAIGFWQIHNALESWREGKYDDEILIRRIKLIDETVSFKKPGDL